jgi:hypothetical protein
MTVPNCFASFQASECFHSHTKQDIDTRAPRLLGGGVFFLIYILLAFWVVNLSKIVVDHFFKFSLDGEKRGHAAHCARNRAHALCCFAYCGKIVRALFMIPFVL